MKKKNLIKQPTKREIFTLRLMIVLGLASMVFFLIKIFDSTIIGNPVLYWMLMVAFIFTCLKIVHEWCHYFYITVPEQPVSDRIYSVDILTTFCAGEPYSMIEETLVAIQAITYPHKTYLCDEANDARLKEFCQKLGVHHMTRKIKINAKAGNINNALQQSSGELCVVLDPDHVPFPDFLDPIVNHFVDPKIGYVQIVQAYKNNEESLIAKGAAQQTYQFYGPMMMTMNKYGTVLAIGANCTFRRSALESIGGHAAGLAEDMHTSMQLHAKGWKSVYVPAVLARGLVPSTLSAYYSQQLKWSRGVFDLLVTAYPKLFSQFTWRQKLHYGVIPLHYLSGIIYLINFLIPIIALCTDESPMRINIAEFGLLVLPFVSAIVLIRHFVQWWVMEDKERGFHIVGGFLMIGTWWIFILGFVYTILRTKVPYVPTPKDGNESNNWPLNIPNIIILLLSVFSIFYGLSHDWNPYNLAMSVFAAMNALFMGFTILASRQQQVRALTHKYKSLLWLAQHIKNFKMRFWVVRRRIYTGVRSTAFLITISITSMVIYLNKFHSTSDYVQINNYAGKNFFLSGVEIGKVAELKAFSPAQLSKHPDIVSFSINWEETLNSHRMAPMLDSIYQNGSIPFISWKLPERVQVQEGKATTFQELVFTDINTGKYDRYLTEVCNEIKRLRRPVFISFAPESDSLSDTLGLPKNNYPEQFKSAWAYIHDYFESNSVYHVVWVWNPARPESISNYFPGSQYVDWIAICDSTYAANRYMEFRKNPVFHPEIPVLLLQRGNVALSKIPDGFPEIKGIITSQTPHWQGTENRDDRSKEAGSLMTQIIDNSIASLLITYPETNKSKQLSHFRKNSSLARGVNYRKGQNWQQDLKPVKIDELISDFAQMKAIGINSVKWDGPGFYDKNILEVAGKNGIQIKYCFRISDDLNFRSNDQSLNDVKKEIIQTVASLQNEKTISSWHLGNPVLQNLESRFFKPELIYQQDAFIYWLKNLIVDIKKIDPSRPVTVDVLLTKNVLSTIKRLRMGIAEIDSFGIITDGRSDINILLKNLQEPYFFSSIPGKDFKTVSGKGIYFTNWQDLQQQDRVTFDGLKDYAGRNKETLLKIKHAWKGQPQLKDPVQIKILKPALTTLPGTNLTYHALICDHGKWQFADSTKKRLVFEWKLIRNDASDNPVDMQDLGTGTKITLSIPEYPSFYRLYLYVLSNGIVVDIVTSTLNTPLLSQSRPKNVSVGVNGSNK